MILFSRQAGQVVSFSDPALPGNVAIALEDWGGFANLKSLITRVGISGQGNFQFLHTLGEDIFIYTFGDRIGKIQVAGLSFDNSCEAPDGQLGIEQVLRYYNTNRLANRRTPVKITIGAGTLLKGYLESINAGAVDPVSRIWEFSLTFAMVPEPSRRRRGADEQAAEENPAPEEAPEDRSPGFFLTGNIDGFRDNGGQLGGFMQSPAPSPVFAAPNAGPNIDLIPNSHVMVSQ
jgi:hypothetical protein